MDDDQRPVLTPEKHILVEKQKTAPLGGAVVGYFERAIWGGNPWARRSNIHFNKSVVVWPRVLAGFLGIGRRSFANARPKLIGRISRPFIFFVATGKLFRRWSTRFRY
jgi:hypothetical protein